MHQRGLFLVARRTEAAEVLEAFLAQFYESFPAPKEILLNAAPANQGLLVEALSLRAGRSVTIAVPQRGNRRNLVQRDGFQPDGLAVDEDDPLVAGGGGRQRAGAPHRRDAAQNLMPVGLSAAGSGDDGALGAAASVAGRGGVAAARSTIGAGAAYW